MLELYRIDNTTEGGHTFIALFREPGTLGSLVAFINEWGTKQGYSGTGPRGFKAMMDCIEKHNFDLTVCSWESDIPKKWQQKLDENSNQTTAERLGHWGDWLVDRISMPILPWDEF